jgi:hypothetical protein
MKSPSAVDPEGTNMTLPLAVAVIVAGAGLATYAVGYGRETWIWYPTNLGRWIRFCDKGPNAGAFEAFAVEIHERIIRAQPYYVTGG